MVETFTSCKLIDLILTTSKYLSSKKTLPIAVEKLNSRRKLFIVPIPMNSGYTDSGLIQTVFTFGGTGSYMHSTVIKCLRSQ